ncbi:MAG: carbon monoxide dehydrogenase [Gammaproteobacteria bacterium]|nr:carbon monoxide dehydrogenase [Gammaproteobacteria bacterium]HAN81176.1 carbon monoxide dehydrogenase [Gammaproteobacteria bacterium]
MEVKLDKRYELGVSSTKAWAVLSNLEEIAACMPGASLGERLGDNAYKGSVKVKVGPATAQFGGEVEILAMDEAARSMTLKGKGADRGGSSASMELEAVIEEHGHEDSVLLGNASVIVNGKFAQFGGRMMVQVSDVILKQFVDNFIAKARALEGPDTSADSPAAPQINEASNELNGLAIFWALIKSWLRGFFGKKSVE